MAIEVKSTRRKIHYAKLCVYGSAGVGKTVLCSTAPKPLILSVEAGLLSLANKDVPVIEITSLGELREAFVFCRDSEQAAAYETICIDSISDIAEQVLDQKMTDIYRDAEEIGAKPDPRQGYGRLAVEMLKLTRSFRRLNKHIVFTSKMGSVQDDMKLKYGPMLPGQQYTQNLPYMLDILCCMHVSKEGTRWLQTQPDLKYQAKDRSGKLDKAEKPDLTALFAKIVAKQ